MRKYMLLLSGIVTLILIDNQSQAEPNNSIRDSVTNRMERTVLNNPLPDSPSLKCVVADSSGSFDCKDAGNFDSTCATAKCPSGYTLTGGGGACAAGDRKIKSLFPRFNTGEFGIACEKQGVAPHVYAICCKL